MRTLVVIPARWGSTRFPGKPMAMIAGHTLLERAIDLGCRSLRGIADADLVVATDDDRIVRHASELGCRTIMTDESTRTGSGRALEAARAQQDIPDFVVNLQGDAPFLPSGTVSAVLAELRRGQVECVTPLIQLSWQDLDALRAQKITNPASGTTCIRSVEGKAIWFSKQIIPMIRDEASLRMDSCPCPVLRHLGLYGFRLSALERFEAADRSFYEALEELEQLRLIELNIPIQTVLVKDQIIPLGGIDTPHDALLAERLIGERGDPFGT